jgi:hypothetical protein
VDRDQTILRWLSQTGFPDVTPGRTPGTWLARRTPETREVRDTGRPYEVQEIAVVFVTRETITSGVAQSLVTPACRWRRQTERWRRVAVAHMSDVSAIDVLALRGVDQVVPLEALGVAARAHG